MQGPPCLVEQGVLAATVAMDDLLDPASALVDRITNLAVIDVVGDGSLTLRELALTSSSPTSRYLRFGPTINSPSVS
ncbi:hypothetical protein [Nocardia miyunensis]|uniref:hypothetical protein n=1 Tax=Nocardia miyunensis TaxID=282684 RepID=UPI00082FAA0C|nr:hypothetical protein [Nocardia miyunensis]